MQVPAGPLSYIPSSSSQPPLQTKLAVPPLLSPLIGRDRLFVNFARRVPAAVTLISAPAGYGKTTVAAQWASATEKAVAWLSLDEGDNDPTRFWRHVAAALNQVSSTVEAPPSQPQPLRATTLESVVDALINDIGNHNGSPLVLVLDDYHLIRAAAVHQSLYYFLSYQPPACHTVIISRSDPPLSLARFRVQGRLAEIRVAELRFTEEETRTFLQQVWALSLTDSEVVLLNQRTEGWPAGLQLAALALHADQDMGVGRERDLVREFAGDHRLVVEYLVDEVLLRQPSAVRRFLLQTSILERLSAPLCNALLQRADAHTFLAYLVRHNLFIIPLDPQGHWYRYHPLFAAALREQLAREPEVGQLPDLHVRAAHWFAEAGMVIDALHHAFAAADETLAAEIIAAQYRETALRGELLTLQQWLQKLSPSVVERHPRLSVATLWAEFYGSTPQAFRRSVAAAREGIAGSSLTPAEREQLQAEIAALEAIYSSLHAGPAETIVLVEAALPPNDPLLEPLLYHALGNARRLQGELRPAAAAYQRARQGYEETGVDEIAFFLTIRLGQVQVLAGQLRAAADTFRQALAQAGEEGDERALLAGEAWLQLAELAYEWDEVNEAREQGRRALRLARQTGNLDLELMSHLLLARVVAASVAAGAAAGMADVVHALDEAAAVAHRQDATALHVYVSVQRVRLLTGLGRLEEAARWADSFPDSASGWAEVPGLWSTFATLTRANLARLQGRTAEAEALLLPLQELLTARGQQRALIETLLLRAAVAASESPPTGGERGRRLLLEALTLSAPEGYIRTFLDLGQPLPALLSRLQASGPALPAPLASHTERLLVAWGKAPAVSLEPSPEALTARELEILHLVAAGASNRQIADTLFLTVGTVKGHINHILGKLDAQNRTAAVARARALGLITV